MKYTVCLDAQRSKRPALLFDSLELERISKDTALSAFYPTGYFVRGVGMADPRAFRWYGQGRPQLKKPTHTLVSSILESPLPDEATIETPELRFFKNGVEHTINLRTRYNQCLSLFKAVGCEHCPEKGVACLSQAAGFQVPTHLETALDAEDLLERLIQNKTNIGGHEFVHPSKTRTHEFSSKLRVWWEHDFDSIEQNAKDLSKRATNAAETRKFKKTQCVKCPIKDSCTRASWCKGAFPPVEDIIEMSDRRLTEALKKSAWPEWQLWEVARFMGETAKVSRWNVMLTGLKLQGTDGIVATVHRSKTSIEPFGKLKTYEDLATAFGMAATEDEVPKTRGPITNKKLRALLWLTLKTGRGSQRYGWGMNREIVAVGCSNRSVNVKWTNGSYLSSYNDDEITEVSHIAAKLSDGRLADIDQVEVR